MAEGDTPTLEVGFLIAPDYGELQQLQRVMESAEAKVVSEAAKIEQATGGMLNLGGATAQLSAFGGAATREMANAQAAANRAEKAGEALSRQMDRQVSSFGMSRAAAAALAAEQNGLTELAGRLRTQEAALVEVRQRAADTMRAEAVATRAFGTSSAAGLATASTGMAGLGRTAQGTQIEMLEMMHITRSLTEQIATGVNPIRALTMESGRLMTAIQYGGAGVSGFVKQFASMVGIIKIVQNAELAEAATSAAATAATIAATAQRAKAAGAAAEVEIQLSLAAQRLAATDAQSAAASARLAAAYEEQSVAATQLVIAEDALAGAQERAAEAAAASRAATVTMIGGTTAILAPLAVAAGVAFGAFKEFQSQVKDSGEMTRYRDSLGLTHKEMLQLSDGVDKAGGKIKELTDVTVTAGDVMTGLWETIKQSAEVSPDWSSFKSGAATAFDYVLKAWNVASAGITAGIYGTFNIVKTVWSSFPAVFGDLFVQGVNAAITALNALVKHGTDLLNGFIHAANNIPGVNVSDVTAPQIGQIDNKNAGAAAKAAQDIRNSYVKAYGDAASADQKFWNQVKKNSKQSLADRMAEQAAAIKANRTPQKDRKSNDHGLADALKELDAQIKGQQALADAYQVSDAAAMRAEALQKAEEQAIRHKGDVGLFYEKELALAVATRAAEGAKQINALSGQTAAQKAVNDAVSAGVMTTAQAEEQMKIEAAIRPQLAALANADASAKDGLSKIIARLTGEMRKANDEANRAQVLAAMQSGRNQLERLRLETTLIGATNKERAIAIAQLEAEQFLRAHPGLSPEAQQAFINQQKTIAAATADNTAALDAHNEALSCMADLLSLIDERAQTMASTLGNAFGNLGNSLGQAITSLTNYAATQAKLDADHQKAVEAGVSTEKEQALYAQASGNAQAKAIGGVIDATKNLFAQHSAAYKAMDAVEKAYAAAQLARTIASIAPNIAAGAAKMFSALGPFGFAAVAAMVAVMAGFGFSGGTSSAVAPTSPEDLQKATGTGTVLGDPAAKSASIANSLDLMSKTDVKLLDNSAGMLNELRSISSDIGNLAAAIARDLNVSGGFFDTTGKLGTNSSGGFLGLFGSTTTKSLYDQGYQFDPATIQQIIQQGITGATYQVIESVKHKSGFLGIGSSTKTSYDTTTGPLDSEISGQIQGVVNQLYKTVVDAAKVLGLDVGDALQQFQVEIGQISFKDLTGQQITDQLNAVFSKLGDQMAGFAVAGLQQFQQAGEGLYQTLMRLAKDYLTIDAALKSIDMTFGSVGASSIAARESLINLAGGLDSFVSQVNFFYDHFLSDSQKVAMEQQQVTAAFQSLGVAQPKTIAGFTQLVQGLDLSTDAGQQMFEALMQIAPAFYDIATAADQLAQKQQELQVQLLQAQGNTAGATALERQVQLAALDPSLQALQTQVWAAQDAAAATAAATELQNKKSQMQIQLLQAQGNATAALALQRQQELAQLDPTLRALQKQIYVAQDVATARDNLAQAYQRESAALQQTIDKFRGFATTLKQFRDSLFTGDSSTLGYNQSLVQLMKESGLANAGDEGALGGGLQDAASKFLDIATQNAGSLQDVQRARAMVARYIDQAAATANSRADVSQQQLDSMHTQVAKLADIDDHILSVADAIKQLNALLRPPPPVANSPGGTGQSGGSGASHNRHLDKILDKLHEIHTATETGATAANTTARTLKQSVREGAMVVRTDSDTPIAVTGDTVSLA